ncbi:hypothetical protein QJS10_CPA02g00135 [Acorus calamus]|uniref:Uncharacterized protein n=1 Tax=Acorus calamus TaxID=4465 RepID=A0AAV9FBE3_ACOCL|nr:hypothetical protein QJS10_CPA02g00135 [Acorus calamus]
MHNCRVFSYYGGVQKLTALMKAAVVQLKTLFSTLAADEVLSQSSLEKTKVLQKILIYVVSVIHTLMDFNSSVCEKSPLHTSSIEVSFLGDSGHDVVPLNSLKGPVSEARFHWQQKAITLVMEAGGLNWLVELLRVIRRLNMKAQWTEISLQYLTLVTLRSALSGNPRAQNHFRSIGGLEVLLDGLGLPSSNYIVSKTAFQFSNERNEDYFYRVFHLQILSLEVLRESTFGNLYNLQFLCENGRIHKFANSICWPAFMVQEFQQHMLGLSISGSRMISQISTADVHEDKNFASESCFSGQSDGNASSNWSAYAAKLSQALCSFLLTPDDIKVHQLQGSVGQSSISASISYWELAVKWFMKVLFTLFPCIKACSNQTVLPSHIRKLLISSATLFEVFRQEGIWDLIFSDSFFYFKGVSEEISGKSEASLDESDIIQMEVISFLEFAATLTGNTHNVPECSALLDALEQSSCNPEIASVLVKSLHRILQLSNEQTISSFKTLDAIARILKVACIQAEEFRKLKDVNPSSGIALHLEISPKDLQKNSSCETAEVLVQCMAASMEIFTEFVSVADNARKTFNHAKEREKDFVQLSIDLLVGMRDVVLIDPSYYQDLFRDGECFLHIVSLLNGMLDEKFGEQLVLNVLETLTFLLSGNDVSKGAFKALVGAGYQTLQNLLLDICHWQPTSGLLDALLDMLVDGKFSIDKNPVIKLIQIVGGHSISGKDIRRIFALLRSEKIGSSEMFHLVSIPTNHLGGFSDNCRSQGHESFISRENDVPADQWWKLYDKLWVLICAMNGKGPSKIYSRTSTTGGPSFGQRARGLVESLNIPAAEMAAVVVSGSIGNALGGKTSKGVDKAMLLRGEKCPRIIFRLVILYLSKSVLERASKCVQQFISLLPCLLASDDEHSKITTLDRSLLATRKLSGMLDDGARFQLISHLIRETVNFGKSVIATSILGREDSSDASSSVKEISSISNLIQKERLLVAVVDEVRFMKTLITDRSKQLQEFHVRMDEAVSMDIRQRKMFDDENCINLEAILSSDDSRRVASQLAYDEDQQIVAEKWIHMFRALIDERGPWSAYSFPNEIVTHWKLDKTEDLWRRRPKLRRNYHFDEKLCHPPTITCNTATHLNESHSGTGSHFPEQMKHFLLKGVRGITEEVSLESIEDDTELSGMTSSLDKSSESEALDVVKDSKDQIDTALDRKDQSSSTAETEFSNEVLLSIPCVLITPKRKLAGRLAVMRHVLHFFGEFLVEGTGGSSVFKNFSDLINHGSTKSEQLTVLHKQKLQKFSLATVNTLPDNLVQDQQRKIKRHRRWNVGKIKAVHWTRYLLQYTAIEIFFHDSVAPVFLNFASQKDAKDAGMLIVSKRNELLSPKGNLKDKNGAISFIDRRIAVEMAEIARESWRRREMSNFEYLMVLNTLAGRSYNDLTQYPVFPWVLADYSSEKLDFNTSSTFRDLSKPVGALDIKRFEGGKFDHADRLFQSIEGTYRNCLSNTSDVKELIPEFFYMPEFLTNSNSYHLGVKQDGEPLGDVSLPPWAKGSLEEFIYKNREALESEYVSSNLHHWIDLVFGYKQRGKPAVEVHYEKIAANIFYYLTYEGAVDMDAMEDESQRLAIEDQIANFGQTPIQIFRKKHPRRGPPIPIAHPLYFAPASITLTSMISISSSAILYIGTMESNILFIDQGLTMSVKMWLSTQMQSGGNFTFYGSQEPFFGIGSDVLTRKVGIPLAENIELGAQCFTTLQTPNENFMVLCGNWENSFQVISLNDGRMVQNIRQHKDVVSCLAVSSDGSVLATGSYDTTVMVFEVSRARMTEKRFRNAQSELPRRDYVIVENPVHILCGHDDIITCLYVSVELDIVISGSRDGTCIFHTLRDGKYVRSIRHPSNGPLSRLAASQHGRVVFYADNDLSLHTYSINGKHIATSESNGRINCMAISSCGEFLVCAGDHGHIFLRSMHSLDIVKRYEGVGKIITSLTVTPEECFLAGTKDGNLLIYSIENPQLRRGSLQRNMKSKSYAT